MLFSLHDICLTSAAFVVMLSWEISMLHVVFCSACYIVIINLTNSCHSSVQLEVSFIVHIRRNHILKPYETLVEPSRLHSSEVS